MQHGGGYSVQMSTLSLRKRHTFGALEDVQYGSVTSSVWTEAHTRSLDLRYWGWFLRFSG